MGGGSKLSPTDCLCSVECSLLWTTLVSVLRGDGMPRRGVNQHAGVALREARARKERKYPELVREGGKATLVVLAGVVGDSRLPLRSG